MSLNNLKARLNYAGGANPQDRMNADKLRSLKGALLRSYQAATIVLSDGRAFRGLINPDRISLDLDNKELSIPFFDRRIVIPDTELGFDYVIDEGVWEEVIALEESEGTWNDMEPLSAIALTVADSSTQLPLLDPVYVEYEDEEIGVQEGDIIKWRENGTYWIVLMRRLEETAYFRGNIYRCRHMVRLNNGSTYWAYIRGPVEQNIVWSKVSSTYFNQLNYSLLMRITANKETLEHFKRFAKITIDGKPWEVQAVDRLSTPGLLNVALKESFSNPIETDAAAVAQKMDKEPEKNSEIIYTYIAGNTTVYPYDVQKYLLVNRIDAAGSWRIVNESKSNIVKISDSGTDSVELQILTGKTGSFTLEYVSLEEVIASIDIAIASL